MAGAGGRRVSREKQGRKEHAQPIVMGKGELRDPEKCPGSKDSHTLGTQARCKVEILCISKQKNWKLPVKMESRRKETTNPRPPSL